MDPVRKFFVSKGLPWNSSIEEKLSEDGYNSVELIKFMEQDEWEALFANEKVARKRLALKVFQDLKEQPVKTSSCDTEIPISPSSEPSPKAQSGTKRRNANHTENHIKSFDLRGLGFSLKKHPKKHKQQHWTEHLERPAPAAEFGDGVDCDDDDDAGDEGGDDIFDDDGDLTRVLGTLEACEYNTNTSAQGQCCFLLSPERMRE